MFNDWGKQEINTPTAQISVMNDEFEIWEVGGDHNNRIFKFTETIPGVYSSKQARNELLSYIKKQGYHFSNPSDEARIRNGNLEDITNVSGEYIYIEK
ncbi:MAG: hypothetical protein IJZ71_04660 [Treponema sp.]|nr:hypothetical protein [Treponema sp.]